MRNNGIFDILECNKLCVGGKHLKDSPAFVLKSDTEFLGNVSFRQSDFILVNICVLKSYFVRFVC